MARIIPAWKIILAGAALFWVVGCAPLAAPRTTAPAESISPTATALQTAAPGPAAANAPLPAASTRAPSPPATAALRITPTSTPARALTDAATAAPALESLSDRLRRVAAAVRPLDYLGNPDYYTAEPDLIEFDCFQGKTENEQQACLKEAGLYYYQLYQDLPYMWGGNYPYAYSVAAALQAAGDPFLNLKPVNIPTVEEDRYFAGLYPGRSGKPMKAGFDCSGFTFWIMAHAGQPDFLAGRCANPALAEKDYYRCDSPPQMQAGRVIPAIGAERAPVRTILQHGAPGDLIFTEEHVMFYLGEGEVVQAVDVELIGGDGREIPPEAWLQEWARLHPELKMVQRGGVNRTTLEHMGTSFWVRRYTIPETR